MGLFDLWHDAAKRSIASGRRRNVCKHACKTRLILILIVGGNVERACIEVQ